MVFGRNKKPIKIRCPQCLEYWDLNELGRKNKIARTLVLMGESISFMGKSFLNPYSSMLPPNPESWCNSCLRKYMNLDKLKFDMRTLSLKPKGPGKNGDAE